MNFITIIKTVFKNINNTETYEVAKQYLLNLATNNVPSKILNLYVLFIKAYEVLKTSCKKLVIKIKESENELDNYCLKQGLLAVISITKKIQSDAEAMAKLADIDLN